MSIFSHTIELSGHKYISIERIAVLPTKNFKKGDQQIFVDTEFLENMAKNLNSGVAGRKRPITIAHPDLSSAEAQGWVIGGNAGVEGNQLFVDIDWHEDTKKLIEEKKYGYISPVFTSKYIDQEGVDQGPALLALGLTNNPHWTDQKPLFDQFTALYCNEETEMPDKTLQVQFDALQKENEVLKQKIEEAKTIKNEEFSSLQKNHENLKTQLEKNAAEVRKMRGDALISKFRVSGHLQEKHLVTDEKASVLSEMAYHEPDKFAAIVSTFEVVATSTKNVGGENVESPLEIPDGFTSQIDFEAFSQAQKWVDENPSKASEFGDKFIEIKQKMLEV
jgi:hypothetical protein